jgi:hypothetical protein
MKPPAQTFAGVFTDFKLVKTRNVAQVIVEVPIEAADQALATLGGLPRADQSPWVAVARLNCTSVNPPAEPETSSVKIKRDWPMASQIHLRCQEPSLWKFLQEHHDFAPLWKRARNFGLEFGGEVAAEVVREWCGVTSRAQIIPGSYAAERWHSLEAEYEQFQRGQNKESAA